MLHRTTELLARLTNYAGVVVGPTAQVQLGALDAAGAPDVGGGDRGRRPRQRRRREQTIDIAAELTDDQVATASSHLDAQCSGHPLGRVAEPAPSGDASVDQVCADALSALISGAADAHVYLGGTASMASAFDAVDIVTDVLRALEQQFVVVSLVSDLVDRGMSIAIGGEHGVQPLSACSVVVAPIVVDGEHRGSVGVLGPTRMNYPQALATVEVVSDRLARRMEGPERG